MRAFIFIGVLALAVCASGSARGQESGVSEAIALEEQGRLAEALEMFQNVLRTSGNSRDDLSRIYLHLAMLQQASGDREDARDSMYRLLAVDPEPALPASAPPALSELLDEARRLWGGRRLRVEVDPRHLSDAPLDEGMPVLVTIHDDVPGMVSSVALLSGGSIVAQHEGASPHELIVPNAAFESTDDIELEVRLIDEHGGTIYQGSTFEVSRRDTEEEQILTPDGSPTERPVPEGGGRRDAFWVTGWALLGTGILLGAAGGALVGVDGINTSADPQAREDGIYEEVLDTNVAGWVLLGLGSATLIAGIVLIVLGARDDDHESVARLARSRGMLTLLEF